MSRMEMENDRLNDKIDELNKQISELKKGIGEVWEEYSERAEINVELSDECKQKNDDLGVKIHQIMKSYYLQFSKRLESKFPHLKEREVKG